MKISENGLKVIKDFEGLRLTSYQCSAGVWTIGFGHTKGVKAGQTITKATADKYLKDDVTAFENVVNKNVKVKLNQNQFDALVSLCFNIGSGAFKKSTLLKRLNEGDYDEASDQFLVWCKAGGNTVRGLLIRREKERALFRKTVKGEEEWLPSLKGYKGFSVVDGLKQFGYNNSFEYRKIVSETLGIKNYTGTSKQNTKLLSMLKAR